MLVLFLLFLPLPIAVRFKPLNISPVPKEPFVLATADTPPSSSSIPHHPSKRPSRTVTAIFVAVFTVCYPPNAPSLCNRELFSHRQFHRGALVIPSAIFLPLLLLFRSIRVPFSLHRTPEVLPISCIPACLSLLFLFSPIQSFSYPQLQSSPLPTRIPFANSFFCRSLHSLIAYPLLQSPLLRSSTSTTSYFRDNSCF